MTNWQYLLGTPALAAQTLSKLKICACDVGDSGCVLCPLRDAPCDDYKELREWLESEMD